MKDFLELIINGGNVQFGLKDPGLVEVWDVYNVWNQPKTIWRFYFGTSLGVALQENVNFLTQKGCNMTPVCEVNFVVSFITMYNMWCLLYRMLY